MRRFLLGTVAALLPVTAAVAQTAYSAPGYSPAPVARTAPAPVAPAAPEPTTGKTAGSVMVRLRAIGVLPQTSSSDISPTGGDVTASNQAAPELDLSYFFTDHFAVEGIAASTRHSIHATDTALGRVGVGSVWVLPPTVTAQYHFMPHERFSPYVGAGLSVLFFYNSKPSEPTVTQFGIGTSVGGAIQAGFDYNISGRWYANFDVKQIFTRVEARINGGTITAKTWLNPTIVGAGIGYKF